MVTATTTPRGLVLGRVWHVFAPGVQDGPKGCLIPIPT